MTIKYIYENHMKAEIIDKWVLDKQRSTHVYIGENWRNCEFKYDWLNQQ